MLILKQAVSAEGLQKGCCNTRNLLKNPPPQGRFSFTWLSQPLKAIKANQAAGKGTDTTTSIRLDHVPASGPQEYVPSQTRIPTKSLNLSETHPAK